MNKKAKAVWVIVTVLFFAVVAAFVAPMIRSWMNAQDGKEVTPATTDGTRATVFNDFASRLSAASAYSFSGTKIISGQTIPYTEQFSCTVNGGDFAVRETRDGHVFRQLYEGGQYRLIDDTARTVSNGASSISFPDDRLKTALTGKLIRTKGEILGGKQVDCYEIYRDSTVYAFYFDQRGEIVRYYYIYEGNEITIDFDRFAIGDAAQVSFSVPPEYRQQ